MLDRTRHPVAILIAQLALLIFAQQTIAATPSADAGAQSVGVSPLFVDVTLKPGESRTIPIRLTAGDDSDVTVTFQHADFGFRSEAYDVQLIEDDAEDTVRFSTRGWFSTPRTSYEIQANQTMVVPLTIEVPRDARPGTHLGAALFTAVPATKATGRSSTVSALPRTGPLVFVGVTGGAAARPRIDDIGVSFLQAHGPIRPAVTLGNDGSIHYSVTGTISIRGRGITRTTSIPQRFVMPDEPRTLTGEDGQPLSLGTHALPPGRYVVTARLTATPDNVRLTDSATVWIIPWWLRMVIVVLVVLVSGVIALAWKSVSDRRLLATWGAADDDVESELDDEDSDDDLDEFEIVVGDVDIASTATPEEDDEDDYADHGEDE